MIRGTRQKRMRSVSRQRSTSSTRRAAGSKRPSRREPARRTVHQARAKAGSKTAIKPVRTPEDIEREATLKNFGTAIRYFRRRDYEKAAAIFEKVATGPVREIADRARVHLSYCERMRHHESRPKTAEGYYARGVAALNSREFDQALQYLSKSDKMIPNQEYVHYALAAAYGLQGDSDHAFSHLETAIKLRPQNRLQARQDEDFQVLADDPRFGKLLGPGLRQQLS
jgi:tetratricopeptide (TPR) repeat protein